VLKYHTLGVFLFPFLLLLSLFSFL
jgi:hypothetical protein